MVKPHLTSEVFELQDHANYSQNSIDRPSPSLQKTRSLEYDDAITFTEDKPGFSAKNNSFKDSLNDSDEETTPTPKAKASLYHFARFPHDLIYLIPAYLAALVSGISKPIQTILLGKVFTALGKYAVSVQAGNYQPSVQFMRDVTIYTMSIVGLGGGLMAVNWVMLTSFELFSAALLRRARRKTFVRFLNRDFSWYDTNKGVMGTLTSLNRCFSDLQNATSMTLALISQALCTIITCLCISFYYSWPLAFVSLAGLPLIMVVTTLTSRFISISFFNFKAITEDAATLVNWSINSIATVKQFNGQHSVTEKLRATLLEGSRSYYSFSKYAGIQQGLSRFLILSMFVPVFVYGTNLVHAKKVDVGDVLTVLSCSFMISGSFAALGLRLESLNKGQVASAKIKQFLDLGVSSVTYFKNMIGIFPHTCQGSIDFQKVVFRYPSRPNVKVLDGLDLHIPAGKTVFLVGSSGSGKSTISNIVLRMYDISSGLILVDGSPIGSLSSKWLRDNITVVEQQSVLFNTTIEENIMLGNQSTKDHPISSDEMKQVIDFALLQSIIDTSSKGLNTVVGIGGSKLSGGQRQRIALARARIRDTPILILDESVSALESAARDKIMREIRKWRRHKTTIIITHELAQIHDDDYVYVLADGKTLDHGLRKHLDEETFSNPVSPIASPNSTYTPSMDSTIFNSSSKRASYRSSLVHSPFSDYFEINARPDSVSLKRRTMPVNLETFMRKLPIPNEPPLPDLQSQPEETVRYSKFTRTSVFRPQSALYFVPPVVEPSQNNDDVYELPSTTTIPSSVTKHQQFHPSLFPHNRPISSPPGYAPKKLYLPDDIASRRPSMSSTINDDFGLKVMKYISYSESSTYIVSSFPILAMCYKRINDKWLLWLGIITAIANGALTPIFSFVVANLMTHMTLGANSLSPKKWIALALTLAVVDGLTAFVRTLVLGVVSDRWVRDLRVKAFSVIMQQDMDWYTQNNIDTNDLTALIMSHSEDMRSIITTFLNIVSTTISLSLICIIWVMIVGWKLGLVGISLVPIFYFSAMFSKYVVVHWEGNCIFLNAIVEEIIHETVSSIRTLRILGLEKVFVAKFDQGVANFKKAKFIDCIFSGLGFGIGEMVPFISQGILLWYGMKLIADTDYTAQQVLMVFTILFFSISSIGALLTAVPQLHTTFLVCFRLFQLLNFDMSLTHEKSGKRSKVRMDTGSIVFSNVHFSYVRPPGAIEDEEVDSSVNLNEPNSKRQRVKALFAPQATTTSDNLLVKVLDSFTAIIPGNKTTAIVGPSGSGKSTLVSLLTKLYVPTGGSIKIDGIDLVNIDTDILRQEIAVVGQMPLNFFGGTIYENITFALNRAQDSDQPALLSEVRRVCQECSIDDFISSLPDGYDTRIGGSTGPVSSGGSALLSGGQMQRIGIARALIRQPRILILDECTSGLDQQSTEAIKETLVAYKKNAKSRMTILIITHQQDVASIADVVITLNEGRVVKRVTQ